VFLGPAARGRANSAAAPVAVGLTFAALLQLGQAVGNLPFNPARAAASAFFSSGWALEQLWVFLAAPVVGAAIAGLLFRSFLVAASAGPGAGAAATTTGVPAGEADDEHQEVPGASAADGTASAPAEGEQADKAQSRGAQADSEAQEFFEGKRA
jgi:aquaporin Z